MELTKEQVMRFYERLAYIISKREGVEIKLVSLVELKKDVEEKKE